MDSVDEGLLSWSLAGQGLAGFDVNRFTVYRVPQRVVCPECGCEFGDDEDDGGQ